MRRDLIEPLKLLARGSNPFDGKAPRANYVEHKLIATVKCLTASESVRHATLVDVQLRR